MSQDKPMTGDQWDVKGKDVPGGRVTRSLRKGLSRLNKSERKDEIKRRHKALNRLRVHARNVEDSSDCQALWALVPKIGLVGFPTWKEVVSAIQKTDFLSLAHRGEVHAESNARRSQGAQNSARRNCAQSVDEYLRWQEDNEFAEDTYATAASTLRRMLLINYADNEKYESRRVATLARSDGRRILDNLAESDRTGERVIKSTRRKHRKILMAWFNWELQRERERAEDLNRQPLFSINIFMRKDSGYSSPTKDAAATMKDIDTRRFFPDEMIALLAAADLMWQLILIVTRCLGLRSGEFIHLRWMDDVRELPNGHGYEVLIEGGRGKDPRCKCRQCKSRKGWAPKNGPRRYILDRRYDEKGWLGPACDALDTLVKLRSPGRGDFLFADPSDHGRPFTNNKLNQGLHEVGRKAGVVTGMQNRGSRTFTSLRHTCASELLELGVDHAHAAYWIGDTLKVFQQTYGRPTDEAMARSIFAPASIKKGP